MRMRMRMRLRAIHPTGARARRRDEEEEEKRERYVPVRVVDVLVCASILVYPAGVNDWRTSVGRTTSRHIYPFGARRATHSAHTIDILDRRVMHMAMKYTAMHSLINV